jgi:hypothetical protein
MHQDSQRTHLPLFLPRWVLPYNPFARSVVLPQTHPMSCLAWRGGETRASWCSALWFFCDQNIACTREKLKLHHHELHHIKHILQTESDNMHQKFSKHLIDNPIPLEISHCIDVTKRHVIATHNYSLTSGEKQKI